MYPLFLSASWQPRPCTVVPDQNRWRQRRLNRASFDIEIGQFAVIATPPALPQNWTLTLIHRPHLSLESLSRAGLLSSFSCKDCLFCLEDSTMNRLIRQYHNGDKVMSLPVIQRGTRPTERIRPGGGVTLKVDRFIVFYLVWNSKL